MCEAADNKIQELVDYILKFQPHCDKYLSKIADPKGKSVLVVGCGHGTEMLWCIRNGATEVIGIDIAKRNTKVLELALQRYKIGNPPKYEILQIGVEDLEKLDRKFELILSNNVFEHLPDIKEALKVCGNIVIPNSGRIAIFADPLYYSSVGAHLQIAPWEHLRSTEENIKSSANYYEWEQYNTLNRMRLSEFINGIVENNLIILKLEIVADRNLKELRHHLTKIKQDIYLTDLAVEGISVELMRLE